MLPFRTSLRGPATQPTDANYKDIVEEALDLFRGNVFFANFEVKGPADRLLVVLILYISRCLKDIEKCSSAAEANRVLYVTNAKKMITPGSPGYSLNRILFAPKNDQEKQMYHDYMDQIRVELSRRLVDRVFKDGEWSKKWWMTFLKRDFMNLEISLLCIVCCIEMNCGKMRNVLCVCVCKYLRYGSRWVFILMCIILSFAEIRQELIGVLF
ncbi:uncharacterized protein [Blastocystis hominis]|uniref:Actin-related protein 2/3 complex subunit 3 n=1 Tax=Blastocystis hominis TaxID=12968 RepID=D8M1H3_BLAHO|nr:uncharacterized protein [Blastocystis hominis]CBK21912.2 unnamed protein product [Blastocystis hominis]|eukprot:XP_012895960.1 uncharacterized protein [Blastocystis hominis]